MKVVVVSAHGPAHRGPLPRADCRIATEITRRERSRLCAGQHRSAARCVDLTSERLAPSLTKSLVVRANENIVHRPRSGHHARALGTWAVRGERCAEAVEGQ